MVIRLLGNSFSDPGVPRRLSGGFVGGAGGGRGPFPFMGSIWSKIGGFFKPKIGFVAQNPLIWG